ACAEFVLGRPAISIEALSELRDLLTGLRASPSCDMPAVKPLLTEVPNEASAKPASSAVQPAAGGSRSGSTADGQKRRTGSRAGRTAGQRGKGKRRAGRGKRRSG